MQGAAGGAVFVSRKSTSLSCPGRGLERPPHAGQEDTEETPSGTGVVESVRKEIDGTIVASCRRARARATSAPTAAGTAPVYDCSPSPGWRTMDQGPVMAFVEYATVRGRVPRARGRRRSRALGRARLPLHAREFEQQVAWLACRSSKTATAELMRIDWASVGGICRRVYDEPDAGGRGTASTAWSASASTRLRTEGPQVLDGRARPRRQPRGLVREGAREGRAQALLRAAQRGSEGQHTGGDGRRRSAG